MGSGDGPTGKVDDPKVKGGSDKGRVALTDGSLDGLRDEFHAETKKQAAQGGSDRTQVADNTRTSAGGDVQDPYEHVDRVKALRKTLDEIHDGKQPNDPEKVRRLKTEVQTEIQAAKDALKTIDFDKGPDSVKELINKHQMDKVRLAGELKLNPNTVSLDQLKSEFAKAKGDKDRQDKIQALATNLQEREALEMIRHAPAYVKLQEAEMSVLGYNNPRLGINDVPQQGTILKAYDTLKQVGRDDPDFKATSMYSDSEKAIGLMVNGQLSQQVIQNMTWATEAAKPENGGKLTVTIDGKKQTLTQEDFLKRANDTVKNINVGFLTSQAELPDNLTSHASEDMMGIVAMAKTAQLEYASYLSDHGKADEALMVFNKVKTDMPTLIYKEDGSYRDEHMEKLDQKITMGTQAVGGDYNQAQGAFLDNLQKGDTKAAQTQLTEMHKSVQNIKDEYARQKVQLEQRKQELQKQEQDLEKKKDLSEADKIEQWRLKTEMRVIDQENAQRDAFIQRRENLNNYMDGLWYQAKEDYSAANQKFQTFDHNEHDEKLKKDLHLEDKLNETAGGFKGWWHRNWGYVAIGAAVVAAAAVTVGTLGAGSALGAGMVLTTVAAVGLGSAAGGGAHWAVERTVHKDAGLNSFLKGAKIGALTSGMIVAPWAVANAGGAAAGGAVVTTEVAAGTGTAAVVEGTALTTGAAGTSTLVAAGAGGTEVAATTANAAGWGSRLLQMGRTIGVSGGRMVGLTSQTLRPILATSATTSFITSGSDYLAGNRTLGQASGDFGKSMALNTLLFGWGGKWAAAKEVASEAPTAARVIDLGRKTVAIGYGSSGIAETYNVLSGHKSVGDAGKDFLFNGTMNTLAVGLLRGRMLNGPVSNAGSEFATNLRYARNATLFNETFNYGINQGLNQYVYHDFLGKNTAGTTYDAQGNPVQGGVKDDQSFIYPLVQDYYNRQFKHGLNPRHPGDNQQFNLNLDQMGQQFNYVPQVDQKFIDPKSINQRTVFGTGQDVTPPKNE